MKLYKQVCEHISHSSTLKVLNHFPLLPMCSHLHTLCWQKGWGDADEGAEGKLPQVALFSNSSN